MSSVETSKVDLSSIDKSHRANFHYDTEDPWQFYLPLKLEINAPIDVVWKLCGIEYATFLGRVPGFSDCGYLGDDPTTKVGLSRTFTIMGLPGQEDLTVYDKKNHTLAYNLSKGPPPVLVVKGTPKNTWIIKPVEGDPSKCVFEQTLQGKFTYLGWIMSPISKRFIQWPSIEAIGHTVKFEAEKMYEKQGKK